MKNLFFIFFFLASLSFAQNIEETCDAYVSILDSCDTQNHDCEELGKALEKSLLKEKVDEKTAHHFYKQCKKVCNLPPGVYREIRGDIKKACIESLK